MFRSLIICPDSGLAQRLTSALDVTGHIQIVRTMDAYPTEPDLVRVMRGSAPDIIFLSFQAVELAQQVVGFIDSEGTGVQIVAVNHTLDPTVLREIMRSGIREFLADPFDRRAVNETLSQVKTMLDRRPAKHEITNQIFSFLPSKAGVGTSTIALNLSGAMARKTGMRVALSDFDLNSGMMRFMLKLQNEYSVTDAVEHAPHMDENLWPSLVTSLDRLDVLHAGKINPNYRIDPVQIRSLVEFMRRNYGVLCFDLSGNLERYSLELMQESKRILLVCTPEVPSLHLAREKLQFLKMLDIDSRVGIVLNRVHKKPLFGKEQVEDLLGVKVVKVLPNDYQGVNKAMTAGTFVAPVSEMGKAYTEFAAELLDEPKEKKTEQKRKFLEFFAVQNRSLAPGE